MIYKYEKERHDDLIDYCLDYIIEEEDDEQKERYQKELNNKSSKWIDFCESGIFHDAIGKPIEIEKDYVVVTTEY